MLLNYQISFKCSECGQLIDSLQVFEKHIWTYHLNDFAYRCAICGLPCLTIEALTGHFATHHEGHTLVEYKRKIEQEQNLKELLASSIFVAIKVSYESGYEHDESTNFSDSPAPISPQVEPVAEEYLQDDVQYTNQCEYSVNVTEPFDEPVDEFLEPYPASTFSNAEYMEERAVLANDENFFVETNSVLYDGHVEQQQQSSANEAKQLPIVSSPERMTTFYKCDICGKMLKYLSKVEEHRRSHTGEKPFSCSYCDKKFTQRGALRCHERLHTGEKPFVCSWDCGKAFVSSSAKMMHERTHAGIRRFSCTYCGQLFGKKYHVERHEKRHRRIIANSTNLYKGDSATGLDAAGEYLDQLLHTVTDVVDSVRLKKNEAKELMINTPGNGRECRRHDSLSSDRVGLFDSSDMLFCTDATTNELLNEIQKADHLNFYSNENSGLGNATEAPKCEKLIDLHHDVRDVKQSRKFYEEDHQSLVKLNNVISDVIEKGASFSGDDEVRSCAVDLLLPGGPSQNSYAVEHSSSVVGYMSNGYRKDVDDDVADYGCPFGQSADIAEHYGYSNSNGFKKEVWHHQRGFVETADQPGFTSDTSELECSSSVDFDRHHHDSVPYDVDYSIVDPATVYGDVCSNGGVESGNGSFVDGNIEYADGNGNDGDGRRQQHMFVSMVDGEEVDEGFASPNDNNKITNGTMLCTKKGPTTKTCEYCGLFLRYPSKIAAHMRTHTGERPFQCEICGQCFSQRTPYRMHFKRHVGDLPHSCSFCAKKFPNKASRNGHELKVHYGLKRVGFPQPHLKRSIGSIGKRATVDPPTLRSPIVNWQSPIDELRKPLSDNALRKITNIVDTVATGTDSDVFSLSAKRLEDRHPPTVAQCAECGLIFKHPSKIQAHMRTHTGEKPFICGECGLGCSTNSALRVHVRRFHTGDRPHLCTWDCGRRFVSVAARNEHERIVHAGIKRYQCTFGDCRRLFTRRSYMVKHLQAHYSAEGINLNRAMTSSLKRNVASYNHKQTHNVGAESFLDEAVNNSRIFNYYQTVATISSVSAQHHNNQSNYQKRNSGNNFKTISLLDKLFVKQHPLTTLSSYDDGNDSADGTVEGHFSSMYYEKTAEMAGRTIIDEESEMCDLSQQLLMSNTDYEENDDGGVVM